MKSLVSFRAMVGIMAIGILTMGLVQFVSVSDAQTTAAYTVSGVAFSDMPNSSDQGVSAGNPYGGRGLGAITMSGPGFGVTLDPSSGKFSGKAYNALAGYVDFAPAGLTGASVAKSCLDDKNATCPVTGFMRFDAYTDPQSGGWDGQVQMSDPSWTKGVELGKEIAGVRTMSGYAWGGDVVGWVDFKDVKVNITEIKKCESEPARIEGGYTIEVFRIKSDGTYENITNFWLQEKKTIQAFTYKGTSYGPYSFVTIQEFADILNSVAQYPLNFHVTGYATVMTKIFPEGTDQFNEIQEFPKILIIGQSSGIRLTLGGLNSNEYPATPGVCDLCTNLDNVQNPVPDGYVKVPALPADQPGECSLKEIPGCKIVGDPYYDPDPTKIEDNTLCFCPNGDYNQTTKQCGSGCPNPNYPGMAGYNDQCPCVGAPGNECGTSCPTPALETNYPGMIGYNALCPTVCEKPLILNTATQKCELLNDDQCPTTKVNNPLNTLNGQNDPKTTGIENPIPPGYTLVGNKCGIPGCGVSYAKNFDNNPLATIDICDYCSKGKKAVDGQCVACTNPSDKTECPLPPKGFISPVTKEV